MADTSWHEATAETERSAEEIQHHIVEMEEEISETVDEISDRITGKLDWHEYVAQNPFLAVGVAAGVGFLASWLLPWPSPAPSPVVQQEPEGAEREKEHREGCPPEAKSLSPLLSGLGSIAFMIAAGLARQAATEAVFGRGHRHGAPPEHKPPHRPEPAAEQMEA
jgi:ElaB/YqjD/DUF883 family membrane-anchored ribosome-binding protein